MSRVKKVLASAMVVFLIATIVAPAAVSAKPNGQCSGCKQGVMKLAYTLPLGEMMAYVEVKYEEVKNPPYKPFWGWVQYTYHYNKAVYRCNHCGAEENGRVKVIDSKVVLRNR